MYLYRLQQVIKSENNMLRTDEQTHRPTDQQTDGRTKSLIQLHTLN